MRLVADLADAGIVRGAIAILGDRVIDSDDRIGDAANAWLALSADQREKTTLLPSSRDGRAAANQINQDGLREDGKLQGAGRAQKEKRGVGREGGRKCRCGWRTCH